MNKLGNGTACVFVRGEGAISAQYASADIPVNAHLSIGNAGYELTQSANAFAYPGSVLYIGVLPRAQVSITLPSFAQVNSGAGEALTGSNVLAAGATNMTFQYKQLFYVNSKTFSTAAIDLAYEAPTGSSAYRGPGPSYTIDPIFTLPLPKNFGATIASPIINSTSANPPTCSGSPSGPVCSPGGTQRGWSWTPQLIPYWESPGGTELALLIQHNFGPNVTPVVFSAAQLFGRHLELAASYGGFTYSSLRSGPVDGLVSASTNAYPSLFSVSLSYLIGHSDLPAGL